ncbi:MAG: Omp28-related outer membrane protein, partial [Muribaculaceae bacterium]|nr:Omp28-related outer membrane protein [Muribaculaceae bacterium]
MNIKNILYVAASTFVLIPLVMACDNISEDDRFIIEDKPVPSPHAVPKTLLIQEFTGVKCSNCPSGAQAVHDIQSAYPDKVIAVSVYPDSPRELTTPWNSSQDFRTSEAKVLYAYYQKPALPAIIFNGILSGTLPPQWSTIADPYLLEEGKMTISLISDYSEPERKIKIKYDITFTDNLSEQLNLMVWLTEDGIVGRQSSLSGTIRDYVHNHVLRKSFFSEECAKELG